MPREPGQSIIMARLLILQSKRLMMSSCQRRLDGGGYESIRGRLERLRADVQSAQYLYRSAILSWESPENHEYWLTAYSRLIDIGHQVIDEMKGATVLLPSTERHEVAADVERLETMIKGWANSMKRTMTASVA